jgi:homoserine dehydrogenase
VLLLGLGTVGFGVYQRLLANAEQFQVVGALVRDRVKYERLGVPGGLLRTRLDQAARLRADIVVDMLPDADVARQVTESFLARGAAVVSAGKALIVQWGVPLAALAERSGGILSYSAAVGGATPMSEAISRCLANAQIAALTGILNGTCNFVLDRCAEGATLEEALGAARGAGFAEGDAREDLNGEDAARKLGILSRHAFGAEARLVELQRLDDSMAERAREVIAHRLRLRQVARVAPCDGEVRAAVRFEAVPESSPFGRLHREWNALQILTKEGTLHTVTGRGAGRWPTTEAAMADIFEVRRQLLRRGSTASVTGPVVVQERASRMLDAESEVTHRASKKL